MTKYVAGINPVKDCFLVGADPEESPQNKQLIQKVKEHS